MQRFKTYDSTGVAPNGRFYASDLNTLQDLVAAINDLAQHLSVGDVAIGESSMLLSLFGSGQLQVPGVLRVSSGTLPGVFTTTQRNAIAVGKRPTGLVIYNSTTNQLEVNAGTDPSPSWVPVGTQAPTYGTSFPASPVDAQEHYLVDSTTNPTWQWHFRYNANSSSSFKWEAVGGAEAVISGTSFTVPRSGDYLAVHHTSYGGAGTTTAGSSNLTLRANGSTVRSVQIDQAQASGWGGGLRQQLTGVVSSRINGITAGQVIDVTGDGGVNTLLIRPYRCS